MINSSIQGSDGSPGAFVFSVQAEDADDGTNGEVIYSLVGNGADQFAINATSGEILVSPIGVDYERFISNNTLELSVIATDQGRVGVLHIMHTHSNTHTYTHTYTHTRTHTHRITY